MGDPQDENRSYGNRSGVEFKSVKDHRKYWQLTSQAAVCNGRPQSQRMTGWDLARVARERDPAFPVIYMTGTAAEDWQHPSHEAVRTCPPRDSGFPASQRRRAAGLALQLFF
jgi:hypothetical protein